MKHSRMAIVVLILLGVNGLDGNENPLLKMMSRLGSDSESNDEAMSGAIYLRNRNGDSNEASEVDSSEKRVRFRREDVKPESATNGNKVVINKWGTYEEQTPVVVQNGTRSPDSIEYRSREDSDEWDSWDSSNTYEDYEAGRFEGRQLYSNHDGEPEQEQSDGYYRQKYYATTAKPTEDQGWKGVSNRPNYAYHNRPQRPPYGEPQPKEEPNQVVGFIQKAKTFYDIFRAMNDAWKTLQDRYRKNGQGIFPGEPGSPEQLNTLIASKSKSNQLTSNNSKQSKQSKRPRTTKSPTTIAFNTDDNSNEDNDNDKRIKNQEDGNRARRSSANEETDTSLPKTHSSSTTIDDDSQSSESDSQSTSDSGSESESESVSPTSDTAVAEGRYIKGDPLKGYYDFVITEGSYKFWAAFQVGTALLIIYSTFAAIYYSKVNPLVSDYDYIDYLGGGRSLSDDSDFVDTDVTATATSNATQAVSKGRQQDQVDGSSAGWFSWLPHAGHTLRFILESIDKGYNDE